MKTEVLPIDLGDGNVVFASISMLGGEEDVAARGLYFNGAVDIVTSIGKQLSGVFDSIKPQKATVEFGLKLSSKAGVLTALLVDASGDASLKIELEWNDSQKKSDD